MIPAAISARLAVCSEAELDVLWLAFADLITGIEKGRTYGREPGRDGRDYVAEAREELRDGLLYLAMAMVQSAKPSGAEIVARFGGLLSTDDVADIAKANGRDTAPRPGQNVVARCRGCGGWTMFHADAAGATGREWAAECRRDGDLIEYRDSIGEIGPACKDADGKKASERVCNRTVRS